MDWEPVILEIGPGNSPVEKCAAVYIDIDSGVLVDERYHLMDARLPLPWSSGTFDRVVTRCFHWFIGSKEFRGHHGAAFDWIAVVSQWMDVLKPEGKLIIILDKLGFSTNSILITSVDSR
jgi:SAM-dependent methyltransferase